MPVIKGLTEGIQPLPQRTVSEWADQNIILTTEMAAEPGPWRTDRAPYQREMLDVGIDPNARIIVYKTSAQVGKTSIMLAIMGYHIDYDPCPMMFVLPTGVVAEAFSKAKLRPFLDASPVLKEKISPDKGRSSSNTINRKEFPGGFLNLAGSNTPEALAMQSIRNIFADEVDRFAYSAGKEGDPLTLALNRSQTFFNRRLILSSTPTVKGLSKVDQFYDASDRREYFVPCPHCGKMQSLKWDNVKFHSDRPEDAEYVCFEKGDEDKGIPDSGCGGLWSDIQVKMAVRDPRSKWVATNPLGKYPGFYLWKIYSPWVTLKEICSEFVASEGKTTERIAWWNTTLGLSWDQEILAQTTAETLLAKREVYAANLIPKGACVVVGSVDVQADRLEVLLTAYGPNNVSWQLRHIKIMLDPSGVQAWDRLREVLSMRFRQETHPHISRPIEGVAIDSGYLTQTVYAFCAVESMKGRPWYPIKGARGPGVIAWQMSQEKLKKGVKLHIVGTDGVKSVVYSRLANNDIRSRDYIHMPVSDEFDIEWCRQIISERMREAVDKKGYSALEWFKPGGTRNEALDLTVYADAVHGSLGIDHEGRLRAMAMTERPSTADIGRMFDGMPA